MIVEEDKPREGLTFRGVFVCDTAEGHLTPCYFPLEWTDRTSRSRCLYSRSHTYYGPGLAEMGVKVLHIYIVSTKT